jgi:uncharacterized membrane protein YhaH (DUF805 family)
MSAQLNPYAAPQAAVGEAQVEEEFQDVRFFSTAGRVGRVRYLGYLTIGYFLAVVAIGGLVGAMFGIGSGGSMVNSPVFIGAAGLVYVAMLVFVIFMAIQRLHDCDSAGWWMFLMLVPLVNFFLFLYLVFMPGTAGANRFGAPTRPNTTGMVVLACVLPAFFVIGIVAAIALPAYSDYTKRAHLQAPH